MRTVLLALLVVGCGGSDVPARPDAAVQLDAQLDAASTCGGNTQPCCTGDAAPCMAPFVCRAPAAPLCGTP